MIEGSFSTMANVINPGSSRIGIKTYSSIQTVQYSLRAEGKSGVKYLGRQDNKYMYDAVNCEMTKYKYMYVQETHKLYTREKEERKKSGSNFKLLKKNLPPNDQPRWLIMMVASKKAKKAPSRAMKQRRRTNTM